MQKWPNASDYNTAVQNPRICFSEPEMQNSEAEKDSIGLPRVRSGTFATVYKMQGPSGIFALRCFLKQFDDQEKRYSAISKALYSARLPFMVGFEFVDKGILVNGQRYPILKMEWIQGQTIHKYIKSNLNDRDRLMSLANQLAELTLQLQEKGIAHGDLQNGNILVSNDTIKLIDYDGMFVPSLSGKPSHETGHRNFQHPRRRDVDFGPSVDNFSAWVIYVSILSMAFEPTLWDLAGIDGSEDQLLFRKEDFECPAKSQALKLLTESSNASLQELGNLFQSILCFEPLSVPPLRDSQIVKGAFTPAIIPTNPAAPKGSTQPSWLMTHVGPASVSAPPATNSSKSKPAWLPSQASSLSGTVMPNSSGLVASTPQHVNNQSLSNWIFDSIVDQQSVTQVQFPTSLVLVSRLICLLWLLSLFTFIHFLVDGSLRLVPFLSMTSLITGSSLYVLTLVWRKNETVNQAKIIFEELRICETETETLKIEMEKIEKLKDAENRANKRVCDNLLRDKNSNSKCLADEKMRLEKKFEATAKVFQDKKTANDLERKKALAAVYASADGARLARIDTELKSLDIEESKELSNDLKTQQETFVSDYLKNAHISHNIPGIWSNLIVSLRVHGFENAQDIIKGNVIAVSGIGKQKANTLESWAYAIESEARRKMPSALSSNQSLNIRSRYKSKKEGLLREKNMLSPSIDKLVRELSAKYAVVDDKYEAEIRAAQSELNRDHNSITLKYSQENQILDVAIEEAQKLLEPKLKELDDKMKPIHQQMFGANLKEAKARKKLTPYKTLSFKNYLASIFKAG